MDPPPIFWENESHDEIFDDVDRARRIQSKYVVCLTFSRTNKKDFRWPSSTKHVLPQILAANYEEFLSVQAKLVPDTFRTHEIFCQTPSFLVILDPTERPDLFPCKNIKNQLMRTR